MIYVSSIVTSKSVSESPGKLTRVEVSRGLVYRVQIVFPPGPLGLLHCQIYDGSYQFFPATPGESFHSNDEVISFDELYLKENEPLNFTVKTWNNDDTYQHEIQVRIAMASKEEFKSRYMPSISWERFSEILQEAESQRQSEQQTRVSRFMDQIKNM